MGKAALGLAAAFVGGYAVAYAVGPVSNWDDLCARFGYGSDSMTKHHNVINVPPESMSSAWILMGSLCICRW